MSEEEFGALREVLRSVFRTYATRFPKAPLTRTLLEKVIYEFKVSLPPEHELVRDLGFYWYLRGYFSDRLYSCLDYMREAGELQLTDEDLLTMPARTMKRAVIKDEDLERRIQVFLPILDDYSPLVKTDDIITKHYLKYAPSPFCVPYNRSLLPSLQAFLETVSQGVSPVLGPRDLRAITRARLDECTRSLPMAGHYAEFKTVYLLFEKTASRLVEYATIKELDSSLARRTLESADDIWQLFCLFLREKAYDPSMSYRVPYWRDERRERWSEVARQVSRLYDEVVTILGEGLVGEHVVDKDRVIEVLQKALSEDRLLWVDTDTFGLDWAELRAKPASELRETLAQRPFTRLFVRYVETDGEERDYVFKIREPVAAG